MVRTKSSIAYFPKLSIGLVVPFIIYRMNHVYPFMNTAMVILISYLFALMGFTIVFLEMKVYRNQGPNFHSPRLMYHPLFSSRPPAFP